MVKRITKPAPPKPPQKALPLMEAFTAENGEGPVSTLVRVLDENGLGLLMAEDVADGTADRFNNDPESGKFTLARRDESGSVIIAAWEGKYLDADVTISAHLDRVEVTIGGKTERYYKSTGDSDSDLAIVRDGGHACAWDHLGGVVTEHIRYALIGPAYGCLKALVGNLEDLGFENTGDVLSESEYNYESGRRVLQPLDGCSSFATVSVNDLGFSVSLCVKGDRLHVAAGSWQPNDRRWYIRTYQIDEEGPEAAFFIERQEEMLAHFGHSIQFGRSVQFG